MRRNKHGPALFELLANGEFRSRDSVSAAGDEAIEDCPVDDPGGLETGEVGPSIARPTANAASVPVGHQRAVEFDGDRLRFSLTSIGAAVASFVLIVLLAGGFMIGHYRGRQSGLAVGYQAGRASYQAATIDDIEAARRQTPSTYLIGGLIESPADPGASPAALVPPPVRVEPGPSGASAEPTWLDGFTYVVAQEFPGGSAEDAAAAEAYLGEHGVDTAIVGLANGRFHLITTQGYNRKDPTQRKLSDQLLEKVRAIGVQYYSTGGRYKLEGYLKTYKGES